MGSVVVFPAFDIEGGLALALMRGLSVAALLSVFGALLFRAAVAPPVLLLPGLAQLPGDWFLRRWRLVFWASWAGAILATLGWMALQAASMADADSLAAAVSAMPSVLTDTRFGQVLLLRLAVLALLAPVLALVAGRGGRWLWLATGLAAMATALQAGHGHAASMYDGPSLLLLSGAVHLLAAGAWLGGLLPLLALIAAAPPEAAALAARRFSTLGTACVLLLAVTAAYQSWVLIGGLPGLIGTGYGLVASLKLALFAALLGFACDNRFRLTPGLTASTGTKRRLVRSIGIEAGVGLLVVLAAGLLTSLPPAMHLQPLWPFAQRLSLDAVREDADFRFEVLQAACALAGAVVLLASALFARRLRWPAVALAGLIAWFAVPHLDLLLAEAHPTSFYLSPTGFAATAIMDGARLYPEHCAACHGAEGHGDGPAAADLPVPPADLTASHLWAHSDGELFWWLSHGIDAPNGGSAMPGFAATLSDDERWDLIDYIRAHNAGVAMAATKAWQVPVQAPELQVACAGAPLSLHELHGRFVRLIVGAPSTEGAATTAGDSVSCTTADKSAELAYGTISGIPSAQLPGTQFLIDGQGWLRALERRDGPQDWDDPQALAAQIRELAMHPVDAAPGPADHMNMQM